MRRQDLHSRSPWCVRARERRDEAVHLVPVDHDLVLVTETGAGYLPPVSVTRSRALTDCVLRLILTQSKIRSNLQRMPTEEVPDLAPLLREHGVQVTAQRLAVLRAVSRRPHGTADDIEELVRADIGAISRQAVYDALGTLADTGLIRRIQPARSAARYEDRVDDNHHHLVCRACGRTVDVDCAVGNRPCLEAADAHGFTIDEAEVVYWGTCPACIGGAS